MTDEQKKQFTLRISQANKSELVIILYDMFGVFIGDALQSLEPPHEEAFQSGITKAKETVQELMASVNPDHNLATNYRSLYGFAQRRLTSAGINHDAAILIQLKNMMESLKKGYLPISKQDTSDAVMGNVQSVYAGLTYGKHTLNENIQTTNNRGFLA